MIGILLHVRLRQANLAVVKVQYLRLAPSTVLAVHGQVTLFTDQETGDNFSVQITYCINGGRCDRSFMKVQHLALHLYMLALSAQEGGHLENLPGIHAAHELQTRLQ